MPPTRRAAPPRPADAPPPLVALLDAATEAGEVDARALAEALGVGVAALPARLAAPGTLGAAQLDVVARTLRVDRALLRTLARATRVDDPPEEAAGGSDDGRDAGRGAPAAARGASPLADEALAVASTGALLEGALAAIADGAPWTRAAHLAVLDAAEQAARGAGRPVPRELHALRNATLRLDACAAGDGAPGPDAGPPLLTARGAPTDAALALVDDAAARIRALQAGASGWADLFAPLHGDALDALRRRHTLVVRSAPLGPGAPVLVTPPLYGRFVALVDADAPEAARALHVRAALAHVVAGDVGEARPLAAPAPAAVRRAAALAALADAVPFMQLGDLRRVRLGWSALAEHVVPVARPLAPDADEARTLGALRVLLYRRTGL